MNTELVPGIIVVMCCIIMSACFFATETAFSSPNKTRLKAMAEKGDRRADLALRF